MNRKNLFLAVILLVFLASGCGGKGQNTEKSAEAAHEREKEGGEKQKEHAEEQDRVKLSAEALKNASIKTAPATAQALADTIGVTATIAHNENRLFHVTPRITGRVLDVRVSIGSEVKPGAVLAVLDSTELGQAKAEYFKAQTLLELAKANYEREKSLFEQKIAAKKDVLAAEAEYRKGEAEARTLHEKLRLYGLSEEAINEPHFNDAPSQYTLTSPGSGVVVERDISKGEVIEAGKKVFTISDLSTVWVLVNVYEKDLGRAQKGGAVKIRTESYPGETFAGKVTYVGDIVDPQSRTVALRVEAPNPRRRLKPGMFATAELVNGISSKRAIMVPSSAIQKIEGKPTVFVQEKDGSFAKRELELGRESGGNVEVKTGLREGEQVVTEGSFTLKSEVLKETLAED